MLHLHLSKFLIPKLKLSKIFYFKIISFHFCQVYLGNMSLPPVFYFMINLTTNWFWSNFSLISCLGKYIHPTRDLRVFHSYRQRYISLFDDTFMLVTRLSDSGSHPHTHIDGKLFFRIWPSQTLWLCKTEYCRIHEIFPSSLSKILKWW